MVNYGGFPYSFPIFFGPGGEAAEVGDMFLSDFNEELLFNLIKENPRSRTRTIRNYYTPQSDYPSTIKEEIGTKELSFSGFFDYSLMESKHIRERKLDYFLSSNNKLLLINIPRDYATLFNLKNIDDVDDASFRDIDTFNMDGSAENQPLGQIRLAVDTRCNTDGTKEGDSEAMQNRAVQLDALNENVRFNLTQNNLKLPVGNYEFIIRAKAEQADTVKMGVLNLDDTDEWASVYTPGAVNILCLKEYKDKLYAGTSDGKIYVTEDGTNFSLAFDTGETEVHCLEEYEDCLYAGTGNNGKIFKYDEAAWASEYDTGETDVFALKKVSIGHWEYPHWITDYFELYAGTGNNGKIFKYVTNWALDTTIAAATDIRCLADSQMHDTSLILFAGTSNSGKIYEKKKSDELWYESYDSDANIILSLNQSWVQMTAGGDNGKIWFKWGYNNPWTLRGDTGEAQIVGLWSKSGSSFPYAGTGNNGKIFSTSAGFPLVKDLDDAVVYCGVTFLGKDYIGTGANGNIHTYRNGILASAQKPLTTTYASYKLPFVITNLDLGDLIQFKATKDGSVAAWVNIDFLCFVATR